LPDHSGAGDSFVVGIISDTHGLLRPEALAALAPAQHILHAGDVGNIDILEALEKLAPVTAIRGNIDNFGPCAELPATELIELFGRYVYMVHAIDDLDIKPASAGIAAVIYGHSHNPSSELRDGVLYLNPGSAGPRRFNLPISVALLTITPSALTPRIIPIL
jgi:putative phosphoesterase